MHEGKCERKSKGQYERIVLAVDFSEGSEVVVKKTAEFNKAMRAEMHVVHILEISPLIYELDVAFSQSFSYENELIKQAMLKLQKIAKIVGANSENCYTEVGSVRAGLKTIVDRVNPDLVIVGSCSHRGLEKLTGSRVHAILNTVKCDVLVMSTVEENK